MNFIDTLALGVGNTIVDTSDANKPRFAMVESVTTSMIEFSWDVDGPRETRMRSNFGNFVPFNKWDANRNR